MIQIGTDSRREKIESVLKQKQPTLTVVLENIHDPHNVSAILRTCDAVGILEVHLVYTNEVFPEISKESSVSAKKWINILKHKSQVDCANYLHEKGFKIGASHLDNYSIFFDEINYLEPLALVFGNEHRGVSDEMLTVSDYSFKIPMHGMIQSLNVSVATAVTLYEAEKQRREKGLYNKLQLTPNEYQNILLDWLLR